ncbi:membrane-associated guanylate kinase, WW and PDZ domain-containing protein 1 isoform X1 [Cottoperca gobio]|nr:PDZ domain-containing protein MAGIX isoform X1 [Cottoperca gobio]
MSHRFVTVRRGSPAARSGQIQPGDQLDAVEGRAVGGLQHRDLAQILRRAGNTLRLSITPRHHSSSLSEGADLDIDGRVMKGSRSRSKVSDQLVEINGDSTSGMTHSQAVEQIRRGGHRIHLVLKKGNGYVPDYGPEEGALSPSSSSHTEEQDVKTVTMTTASLSQQRGGGGGTGGGEGGERRRTRREGETKRRTGGRGGLGPPDLDLDVVEEEAREEEEEEERRKRSQTVRPKEKRDNQREQGRRSRSLPRISARSWDMLLPQEEVEVEESGGMKERRRSETKSRRRATNEEERRVERDDRTTRHAKPSGSSGAPFSFLMPIDDDDDDDDDERQRLSDSESTTSIATAEWREEDSDWRRAEGKAPGPWLKPSPKRLTKVLIGSRLGGRELLGGLSL